MKNTTPNTELLELFQTGRKLSFKRGEIILRAGDEPQGVYLITSGLVKIYALSPQGEERVHLFYAENDVFPLMWAFKQAVRNVYYEALEPTELWILPLDKFKEFVAKDSQTANSLLEKSVGLFRLYAGRIDNLLRSNSHDRVAHVLIALVGRFGVVGKDGSYIIDAALTHQEIASSINLSRETTSRALERLHRKGIIGYDEARHIVIKDPDKLVKVVGEEEVASIWPEFLSKP